MSIFKKILIVSKTTRQERLLNKGVKFTPYIEKYYKKEW